jgi:hypothetical protein
VGKRVKGKRTKNGDRLVIREAGLPPFHPRECFKVLAGTCRDNRKNVVKKMGFNIFLPRLDRGHHIVCIDISDTVLNDRMNQ